MDADDPTKSHGRVLTKGVASAPPYPAQATANAGASVLCIRTAFFGSW